MDRLTENKIVIVKRKTRLEELIARYNTLGQAKFYIEHMGADFSDYVHEDESYRKVLDKAQNDLEQLGRVQIIDREFVPNFIFGEKDMVVAIGQDGLVANTLKYLEEQPLLGVNPDPLRWDGILLPFTVQDLKLAAQDTMKGRRGIKEVTMAKAMLNDGQSICGVNDLFVGQRTHVSSRYTLELGDRQEVQSSSGIIISTGLGSTGWLKSVLAGAEGIAASLLKTKIKLQQEKTDWNCDYLYFSVREPFPSRSSKAELVFGKITKNKPLKILSNMPESGVIFSDGMESDFLLFSSGLEATITLADKKGHLVV